MHTSPAAFIPVCFWAMFLIAPGWSQTQGPPPPAGITYVAGQACVGINSLTPGALGFPVLERGPSLTTQAGKVEILLRPGVFLRVAENNSVQMVSPDFANTRSRWKKAALVEQG